MSWLHKVIVTVISAILCTSVRASVINYWWFEEGSGSFVADSTGLADGILDPYFPTTTGAGDSGELGWSTACVGQTTWHVSAANVGDPLEDGTPAHPFDTIQEALNAASDGDTVLVLDGLYRGPGNKKLDFLGKTVSLVSANGPSNTEIDCETAECFLLNTHTNAVYVAGFTVTNGSGTAPYTFQPTLPRIFTNCVFRHNIGPVPPVSGSRLLNCVFEENQGISVVAHHDVMIDGCLFQSNRNVCVFSGSHYFGSGAIITNSVFRGNQATAIYNSDFYIASGIRVVDSLIQGNARGCLLQVGELRDTVIEHNQTEGFVGATSGGGYGDYAFVYMSNVVVRANGGDGIVISATCGRPIVEDSLIISNAGAGIVSFVGGFHPKCSSGFGTFTRCALLANQGGGVRASQSNLFDSCTISNNKSGGGGGNYLNCLVEGNSVAFSLSGYATAATLINCTVRNNGGFVSFGYRGGIGVYNTIAWANGTNLFEFGGENQITAQYSNLQFGTGQPWFGIGCIDADPQFVSDTDSHLTVFSPCIAAGSTNWPVAVDIEGTPRGSPPDMGCYEVPKTDSDSDGLPDWWELRFFGDLSHAPNDDDDLDHLANSHEYQRGTDPTNPDTDGDSLVDGWEVTYGLNPLDDNVVHGTYLMEWLSTLNAGASLRDVKVSGRWAYGVDGMRLLVFDVADPGHPQLVGACGVGGASRLQVWGNYAYISTSGGTLFVVVDVSVPSDPVVVAGAVSGPPDSYNSDIDVGSNRAYLSTSFGIYPDSTIRIFDVTQPWSPLLLGSTHLPGTRIGALKVSEPYAFVQLPGSLWVFDIAVPSNIVFAGSVATAAGDGVGGLQLVGNTLYVAGGTELFSIDVTTRTSPALIGSVALQGGAANMDADAALAVVAERTAGIEVFDTANPANMFSRAVFSVPGSANSVAIQSNLLFVAYGDLGLVIYRMLGIDDDRDGLPDDWELRYFGTRNANASADNDGDGVSNLGEFRAGTDPTRWDTDGDRISDGDEVRVYNSDPRTPDFPDTDADGVPDVIDSCPGTPTGDVVTGSGCSIWQLCPCEGPASGGTWKNQAAYLRCIRDSTRQFQAAGLITGKDAKNILKAAATSGCGK